ncbi:MAG: aminotransferase class IV family protein [Rickettsiales bacterium]|nr:aminotransferase class IV family protein [Rickettsiales bacterium]
MHTFIYKNQRLTTQTQAKISINERGYLFGDGIFETCLVQNHRIYDFERHLKRLIFGLKNLKINFNSTNLEKKCQKLIDKNKVKNGILKIQISRGQGSIGYLPKKNNKALLLITTQNSRPRPQNISLGISSYKTPNQYLGKTSNALNYILSKIEAKENNHFDAIMLDQNQNIAETSSANIFWVKNNQIFTPPTSTNLIPGTKREKLLEISPIKITEKLAKIDELENIDEIFLSNSAYLILPVSKFQNQKLKTDISKKLLKILKNS